MVIDPSYLTELDFFIRKNLVEQHAWFWESSNATKPFTFYDISRITKSPILTWRPRVKLFKFVIHQDVTQIKHSRKDYTFIDLLGDVGGI